MCLTGSIATANSSESSKSKSVELCLLSQIVYIPSRTQRRVKLDVYQNDGDVCKEKLPTHVFIQNKSHGVGW